MDFLSYLRIEQNVQKFIKDCKTGETIILARPFIPNDIYVVWKSKKGAHDLKNNHTRDLTTFISG